jgi:hypothetical protein
MHSRVFSPQSILLTSFRFGFQIISDIVRVCLQYPLLLPPPLVLYFNHSDEPKSHSNLRCLKTRLCSE